MRPSSRVTALALSALLIGAALSGCSRSSGSTEKFCAKVKQVPALESVLARFSEADPDVLADRIAKARAAYASLEAAAPSEIDGETAQVVSLVDDILASVEDHPDDPVKAATQLRKAMVHHKGVEADRAKVAAYAKQQCGVQLDAALGDGTDAATSTTAAGSTTTTGG